MLRAEWAPYRLLFKFEAKTSRQTMATKDTYFIRVWDDAAPARKAWGECALFKGLSLEDKPDYEHLLAQACAAPEEALLSAPSSIRFGFETAIASLRGSNLLPEGEWSAGRRGIAINGLIWMGDKATMAARIREKLAAGFNILKLKIGGIDFGQELELLRMIRATAGPESLEIRLDANGSFSPANALARLDELSRFGIHSLEQPIKAGQWGEMARICRSTPIPVALDEELIGLRDDAAQATLLSEIKPQFIILKPSLCGGFGRSAKYIEQATARGIGWWLTSALESDIGLNAIARFADSYSPSIPQGLGTGQLYHNNIPSPLGLRGSSLWNNPDSTWQYPENLIWTQPNS